MKTVCVVVVALSLISVCCSAPLACDKLSKPIEGLPDVSGRWYVIGLTSSLCLPVTIINTFIWPSYTLDFVSQGKPNLYHVTGNVKTYGMCYSKTIPMFVKGSFISDVDKNDAPGGNRVELLQTSCPDCFVALGNSSLLRTVLIASRRKTLTAAELEEFEMQAKCLGMSKPQYYNTDFDYEHCRSPDTTTHEELFSEIRERVKSMGHLLIKCMIEAILYLIQTAITG